METKINVAEILKDKPKGIRLYSPIFGECAFCYVREDTNDICVKKHNGVIEYFSSEGLYCALGEVMLFPSKSMRDWRKFTWKRGDVLVNSRGLKILFDRWANDNYTSFYAKTINLVEDGFLDTNLHTLASEEEAKSFIKCIEERFGGKLNLQTLEIQKQPEFKDGDVLFVKCRSDDFIEIFNYSKKNGDLYDHASLVPRTQELDISGKYKIRKDEIVEIRLATEEEKKQLFSVLAKKGKTWDSEKKEVIDLKPRVELKPFYKDIGVAARLDDEEYYDSLSNDDRCLFEYGFRRGYNQALKGLLHPASEVPRNDNGKVLAFSRIFCNRKLYNMNAMRDETTCNTYQEMWENEVYKYCLSDWIFVDELFDLITKGGEQ